jgi:hypothetical protein
MWAGGLATINYVENLSSDSQYFKHRYYLLNLLIVCCSSSLSKEISSPTGVNEEETNFFLAYLTNKKCPMIKTLVFSLLNCILNYDCDGLKVPYANNI